MNFTKFLKSIFGDKSKRDMRLIQPLVEKVKEAYPDIEKLSNDELRAKSKEIQKYVQDAAKPYKDKIAELRAKIEDTPIDEREPIFNEIDKQDKEMLDELEKALNHVMPVAFAIVKDTARRFAQNADTVVTATDFDRELAAEPEERLHHHRRRQGHLPQRVDGRRQQDPVGHGALRRPALRRYRAASG
jgi:preprotein translocase subunit SecA